MHTTHTATTNAVVRLDTISVAKNTAPEHDARAVSMAVAYTVAQQHTQDVHTAARMFWMATPWM